MYLPHVNESRGGQLALDLPAMPLNDFDWDDDGIDAIRVGLLNDLRQLIDLRTSFEVRTELIAWVAVPIVSPTAMPHEPFSFQVCCFTAGVDPEEMREQILLMFEPGHLVSHYQFHPKEILTCL